jgi:hypothetical protein
MELALAVAAVLVAAGAARAEAEVERELLLLALLLALLLSGPLPERPERRREPQKRHMRHGVGVYGRSGSRALRRNSLVRRSAIAKLELVDAPR